MNLPNYFLADLPPEATLNPGMIGEACLTLKRNREQFLSTRSTESLITVLSNVARHWLEPEYPFRKMALENGPAALGFSQATLANDLDSFFRQFTAENFRALLHQELGHPQRLDVLTATDPEQESNRAGIALGPEFLVHITPGKLPNPALLSIALGLLLRSAQFVTCASGTSLLPRLFAHSLYDADSKLAACLEVAEWRGDNAGSEQVLFEAADCVIAKGSEESVVALRQRLPLKTRFLGYPHRVSFAFVTQGVLSALNIRTVIARAAADLIAWNQLGFLSPHVIYVEKGGAVSPEQFSAALAEELARREESEPRGELAPEVAAAIRSRRSIYELRAEHSRVSDSPDYPQTQIWCSPDSTAWTVVFESDPRFQTSCLHRFIYVKSVDDLPEALQGAESVRSKVSTVGLAAPEDKAQAIATELARWGAKRICPLGQMQNPPLTWRHDGRPILADLVTWTDYEMP